MKENMKAISLGYHDIVESLSQGFDSRRRAPGHYALDRATFRAHLTAIHNECGSLALKTIETALDAGTQSGTLPVYLTFDDGVSGSYHVAAEELERRGWRGHFFIVSSWIGEPGFLSASEIRELWQRGHVIGSHSHTHPTRMSHMDQPNLWREWSRSSQILSDILGQPVTCGSVPNGFYSATVVDAAAQAGITTLFTSEPTASSWKSGKCNLWGRYQVMHNTSASTAAAIAAGNLLPRLGQAATWQMKKTMKSVGGKAYLRLRGALLASHDRSL